MELGLEWLVFNEEVVQCKARELAGIVGGGKVSVNDQFFGDVVRNINCFCTN